jgi:hypothetical protein
MLGEYSKAIKRRIRELAAVAYERKLAEALTELEGDFGRWPSTSSNTSGAICRSGWTLMSWRPKFMISSVMVPSNPA